LVLVSCLLVSVACCLFLICQFEYNKKKYVAWKSQPSSGYSTPTDLLNNVTNPDQPKSCLNGRTYIALEDIDTAVSSIEDIRPMLVKKSRSERKKQLRFCFKARQAEIARSQMEQQRSDNFRSLPASPFHTKRNSPTSPTAPEGFRPVTAAQVKKALATKSRRYQRGNFKPLRKPKGGPQPTPTSERKRHSRSLSDVLGLLSNEDHRQLVPEKQHLHPALMHMSQQHYMSHTAPRVLPQRRFNRTAVPLRPTSATMRPSSASTRSATPRSLVGGCGRYESRDTLKPTSSISEFSVQSGEQELEFDLYDYNLDNVVAYNHPGSHFAAAPAGCIWYGQHDYDDATPTAEEFTLTELFPHSENNNPSPPEAEMMLRSRTSDLTASVTSADLNRTPVGGTRLNVDDDESSECGSGLGETDRLLRCAASRKPMILNLTHIDDDIDFADDEAILK
jgi:hypothetical protein